MRSVWITLTTSVAVLVLSGCPDLPGGHVPAKADARWQAVAPARAPHEGAAHGSSVNSAHHADHHTVSEIAWFQGTIDEAFSRRGCHPAPSPRGLFRS